MIESTVPEEQEQTEVGSYFVANYPPFSVWTRDAVATDAREAFERPPVPGTPLGLYLHVPFCRKRCHFCYFRVYTDRNAREVQQYLDLLVREWELYAKLPAIQGRATNFVYFGGGTPSFLSTAQLRGLVDRLKAIHNWDGAEEVTFECEPGTLTDAKLKAIRAMGVTRLSLGVENFNDRLLEINGRAHRAPEIHNAYAAARDLAFPQINIDLIAGMLGETDDNWRWNIEETLKLDPDSVTIYQMELPFNTTISGDILKGTHQFEQAVASWAAKRRWVKQAFAALEAAGYTIGSAYTAVKNPSRTTFVYRDRLWQGADLAALGVASFGHINGVHLQNLDKWEDYARAIEAGELPLGRAYKPSDEERMIREFVLQLKKGAVAPSYFREKYRVDPLVRFREALQAIDEAGYLAGAGDARIALTRDGLMRVDVLLPNFFLPRHAGIRYT